MLAVSNMVACKPMSPTDKINTGNYQELDNKQSLFISNFFDSLDSPTESNVAPRSIRETFQEMLESFPVLTQILPIVIKTYPKIIADMPALLNEFNIFRKTYPNFSKALPSLLITSQRIADGGSENSWPALLKLLADIRQELPSVIQSLPAVTEAYPAVANNFPVVGLFETDLDQTDERFPVINSALRVLIPILPILSQTFSTFSNGEQINPIEAKNKSPLFEHVSDPNPTPSVYANKYMYPYPQQYEINEKYAYADPNPAFGMGMNFMGQNIYNTPSSEAFFGQDVAGNEYLIRLSPIALIRVQDRMYPINTNIFQ